MKATAAENRRARLGEGRGGGREDVVGERECRSAGGVALADGGGGVQQREETNL